MAAFTRFAPMELAGAAKLLGLLSQAIWLGVSATDWRILFLALAVLVVRTKSYRAFGRGAAVLRLRRKGIEFTLAGRAAEAEKCFRTALARTAKLSDGFRVRLLVGLADALMDQARYMEAEDCLLVALQIGDRTGSGQGSMADLLLAQKREAEKVLKLADEALALNHAAYLHFPEPFKERFLRLRQSVCWARKAQALALLQRESEARQALDSAMVLLEEVRKSAAGQHSTLFTLLNPRSFRRLRFLEKVQFASLHLMIGDTWLALQQTEQAIQQFTLGRDVKLKGKYGLLCRQRLEQLKH